MPTTIELKTWMYVAAILIIALVASSAFMQGKISGINQCLNKQSTSTTT